LLTAAPPLLQLIVGLGDWYRNLEVIILTGQRQSAAILSGTFAGYNDQDIIARMIELARSYDSETKRDDAGTIPPSFLLDRLEDDFPNIPQRQFNRCYFEAFHQPARWDKVQFRGE
jgi:hypothetical protein